MDMLEAMRNRRSVRNYTEEPIAEADLRKILQAGLMSATGKAIRPWELIVVQEKEALCQMSRARAVGASMLTDAACAIVVLGDETKSDVWTEDCSIVMANMHLMASSLGIGSCWVQGRLRKAADGSDTESYLRDLLHFPEHCRLEAMLVLGMPAVETKPHDLDALPMEKIHWGKY